MATKPPGLNQPLPMQPGEFNTASVPNRVTFAWDSVTPPSPVYVQRDDVLVMAVTSLFAAETFTLNARLLLAPYPTGGQPDAPAKVTAADLRESSNFIQSITGSVIVTGARQVTLLTRTLSEGYLLSAGISPTNAASRGRAFGQLFLVRGASNITQAYACLVADYCTATDICAWPGGRVISPSEGPGFLQINNQGNPAAGSDWSLTIPSASRAKVLAVFATLVTSAAAANRIPRIRASNTGVTYYLGQPNQVVPASTTADVTGSSTVVPSTANDPAVMIAVPDRLQMVGGDVLAMSTANIQGADQWSNICVWLEQFLDF